MNLIKVIPIYRNKFQEPILFFSSKKFSVGSIVLTLYGKKNKPSLIVEINSLEEKKFFLRSNKIKIQKIDSDFELSLLKNEIIEETKDGYKGLIRSLFYWIINLFR